MNECDIFMAALEIESPGGRTAFLDEACRNNGTLRARVEALLTSHSQANAFLDEPAFNGHLLESIDPIRELAGSVIGPYKLLEQIGEGGFGVVFLAEQERPVRRRVALKIIKPGMDTRQVIARFEAERQALAMMDHPNIAKVLDAGTTEGVRCQISGISEELSALALTPETRHLTASFGRPYFVMELVKGVPITRYCDEKHLALRERLALFLPVCQAVQHAHQKGIIHRDIKPTNVLVADYDNHPVPKVIDFGVAKATMQKLTERTMFTEFGQLVGTVEYMSPEQAKLNQLDIDTRSDIYSLGVLLYELLCGSTPFDCQRLHSVAFDEMLRIIREEEPPKPSMRLSTLAKQAASTVSNGRDSDPRRLSILVGGDLDWIVMKCLEKDRGLRYDTANDLAMDIQRYLDNEPVLASPPSWITGVSKWVHRHRTASIAAGLLTSVIALGATVTTVLLAREQAATAEALGESERKERALQIANDELKKEHQRAEKNLRSARRAVDQMLTRVAGDLHDVPHLTELQRALLEDALKFYQQFLQQDEDKPDLRHETALAYLRVGQIRLALGRSKETIEELKHATEMLESLVKDFPVDGKYRRDLWTVYRFHGHALVWSGQQQNLIELRTRELGVAKAIAEQNPSDPSWSEQVAISMTALGNAHKTVGLTSQAEPHFREALRTLEDLYENHPAFPKNGEALSQCQTWLGKYLQNSSRFEEGEPLLLSALEIRRELVAASPQRVRPREVLTDTLQAVAEMRHKQKRYKQALQHYRELIQIREKLLDDFPDTLQFRRKLAAAYDGLGIVLWDMGLHGDAEDALRRAIFQIDRVADAAPHSLPYLDRAASLHYRLGRRLVQLDREIEAVSEFRQAQKYLEMAVETFPDALVSQREIARFLATCPAPQFQDPQRAVMYARRVLQMEPQSAELWRILGVAQFRSRDWKAADEAFASSFERQPSRRDVDDFFYRTIIAWQLGKPDEAHRWYTTGTGRLSNRRLSLPWVLSLRDDAAASLGIEARAHTGRNNSTETDHGSSKEWTNTNSSVDKAPNNSPN